MTDPYGPEYHGNCQDFRRQKRMKKAEEEIGGRNDSNLEVF